MLSTDDPFGGDLKTCSVSLGHMADNADLLKSQGMTEAQFSGAQAKGQIGVLAAKAIKGELQPGQKVGFGVKPDNTVYNLYYDSVGPAEQIKFNIEKLLPGGQVKSQAGYYYPNALRVPGIETSFSGSLGEALDFATWKFGGATKPDVVPDSSDIGVSGLQAKDQFNTLLAQADKGEVKIYSKVASGTKPDGTTFFLTYQGQGAQFDKDLQLFEVMKITPGGKSYQFPVSKNSAFLKEILDEAQWKFPSVGSKPDVPEIDVSVGSMTDEDIATLFVLTKDTIAKDLGLNIKGANPALDAKTFAAIADETGYKALEIEAKVAAYKKTGKKLSALKKKALPKKASAAPKTPPSPPVPQWVANAVPDAPPITHTVQPNGVPLEITQPVLSVVEKAFLDGLDKPVDVMTTEDLVSQYVIAKDFTAAQSDGKWTLYTQGNKDFDAAIFKTIFETSGATEQQIKTAITQYVSSGKKVSGLKKKLIKNGQLDPQAPTLKKGGTPATKGNVESFADKGYSPDNYVAAELSEDDGSFIYTKFKGQQGTYLTSSPQEIYLAIEKVKKDLNASGGTQVTSLDVVRAIDWAGAKKFGVANTNEFEKKIVSWIASPEGQNYIKVQADIAKLEANRPPLPADSALFQQISQKDIQAIQDRFPAWTSSQRDALHSYTGGGYHGMNDYLRRGGSLSDRTDVREAASGMNPVPEPFLTRRGCDFRQFGLNSYEEAVGLIGKTVEDKGFLSTSAAGKSAFSGTVSLEVEVAAGTRGAYVQSISSFSSEREFIIAPGTKYKVLSVNRQGYQTLIRVRTLP